MRKARESGKKGNLNSFTFESYDKNFANIQELYIQRIQHLAFEMLLIFSYITSFHWKSGIATY